MILRVRYRASDGLLIGFQQDWPRGEGEEEIVLDVADAVRQTPLWAWRVEAGVIRRATATEEHAARTDAAGPTRDGDWRQFVGSVAFGNMPPAVQVGLRRLAKVMGVE